VGRCQLEYKWAEADPLDDSFDFYAYSINSHIYTGSGSGAG
jgi:hypothetical protein